MILELQTNILSLSEDFFVRSKADSLITEDAFKNIIEVRQYNDFSLGQRYEYDVSDFSKVDYSELLDKLKKLYH
jgi:hypothetical protein